MGPGTRTPSWDKTRSEVAVGRVLLLPTAQGWDVLMLHTAFLCQWAWSCRGGRHGDRLALASDKQASTRATSTRAGASTLEIRTFLPSDLKTLRTIFCEAISASGTWTGSFSGLQDLQSESMITEKEASKQNKTKIWAGGREQKM